MDDNILSIILYYSDFDDIVNFSIIDNKFNVILSANFNYIALIYY